MNAVVSAKSTTNAEQKGHINQTLDGENQYVSFWLGDQFIGVPVNLVQEVLNPQNIVRPPRARPEIAGLVNLRGQIVTAIDLRQRLGLPPNESEAGSMNVVIRHDDEPFSFLVDEVDDVIYIPRDLMRSVPPTLDQHWRDLTSGMYCLDERLIVILNVDAVLAMN